MKKLQLTTPLKTPRGAITEISFREPKFEDFMAVGDPRLLVKSGEKLYFQDIDQAIREYIERLADIDPNLLTQLSLADTLAAKRAVLDFFGEAEAATKSITSDAPLTNSSSSPTGTSVPSAA